MKTNYKSNHENACLKRCVLRSVLKQLRSFTALIFDGNLFQSLGADAINDLSPKVFLVMVLGGNNCSSDWDRNIIRPNCCFSPEYITSNSCIAWKRFDYYFQNYLLHVARACFASCCAPVSSVPTSLHPLSSSFLLPEPVRPFPSYTNKIAILLSKRLAYKNVCRSWVIP